MVAPGTDQAQGADRDGTQRGGHADDAPRLKELLNK